VGNLRDCHGRVRVVERAADAESFRVLLVDIEVLDPISVCLDPILGKIGDAIDSRMTSRAVVALLSCQDHAMVP
jgi:hypothetical protein